MKKVTTASSQRTIETGPIFAAVVMPRTEKITTTLKRMTSHSDRTRLRPGCFMGAQGTTEKRGPLPGWQRTPCSLTGVKSGVPTGPPGGEHQVIEAPAIGAEQLGRCLGVPGHSTPG